MDQYACSSKMNDEKTPHIIDQDDYWCLKGGKDCCKFGSPSGCGIVVGFVMCASTMEAMHSLIKFN